MNILEIEAWQKDLGLLPIKLFISDRPDNFILHNGGKSDFCLGFSNEDSQVNYLSNAWSSNTDNYVVIHNGSIKVLNWKRKQHIENISLETVQSNFQKFYAYLSEKSYKSGNDITPFVIKIFRKLRNLLNENDEGLSSLNLLFSIFALYEDGGSIAELDKSKWGLSTDIHFDNNLIEPYLIEFSQGILELKPNLELLIRHSAGTLFQEAHQEAAYFNKQVDLFTGTLSDAQLLRQKFFISTHYTPTYVARTIVESVIANIDLQAKQHLKIFDPACGTSIFLLEILKQLKNKNYEGSIELIGWDTSTVAINTSSFLLNYEKREWGERLTLKLKTVEDSLSENWGADLDVVLMNPPFISWEQMDRRQRELVRAALGDCFDNKPNQAGAFLAKSITCLNDKGILGCVIPSSLLVHDSYTKLREIILDVVSIPLIGKLGNFVFENALTDVSILIAEKSKGDVDTTLLWTKNADGVVSEALQNLRRYNYNNFLNIEEKDFSIYKSTTFPLSNNWKVMSFYENELLRKIQIFLDRKALVKVKDVFTVKQGIRTGNNKVFKISFEDYNNLPDSEKIFFKPSIDNDAIRRGVITILNYVWYPYRENVLLISSEQELQERVPVYFQKVLLPHKQSLISRATINEDNWWVLTRHRAWLNNSEPRLVSTEFGDADSFAFDNKGKFVIERGNAWLPKKKVKNEDFYYFYLAVFSSSYFNSLLSIFSKQLAGGKWWDLGSKFTQNIPIPEYKSNDSRVEVLVDLGKKISNGIFLDKKLITDYLTSFYPNE